MDTMYTLEEREILLDLFAAAAVTRYRIQQLEDSLGEGADCSSNLFQTNLKAHDLLMALRRNLLE
jgi:hypothetical protein